VGPGSYTASRSDLRRLLTNNLVQPAPDHEFFYIYLFIHDFRKIYGPIKIFEKCTSGVVPQFLPPWATAFGVPPTVGSAGRWGQVSVAWGAAAGFLAPWPRRQGLGAVDHGGSAVPK
jgi:hypothetical protein